MKLSQRGRRMLWVVCYTHDSGVVAWIGSGVGQPGQALEPFMMRLTLLAQGLINLPSKVLRAATRVAVPLRCNSM